MRITLGQLRQIIKEEVYRIRENSFLGGRSEDVPGDDEDQDPEFWEDIIAQGRARDDRYETDARTAAAAGEVRRPNTGVARRGAGRPSAGWLARNS